MEEFKFFSLWFMHYELLEKSSRFHFDQVHKQCRPQNCQFFTPSLPFVVYFKIGVYVLFSTSFFGIGILQQSKTFAMIKKCTNCFFVFFFQVTLDQTKIENNPKKDQTEHFLAFKQSI